MTNSQTRSLISTIVIAAAVCGGLHAMVASPLRERAIETEGELAAFIQETGVNTAMLQELPRVVALHERTMTASSAIEARSLAALDESTMFTGVLDLAEDTGVTVEQIAPASQARAEVGSPVERPGDARVRYTLSGTGGYAAVTSFLDRLAGEWAYCAVREARVTPQFGVAAGGRDAAVRLSVTVELFSFDASPLDLAEVSEGTP